MGPRAGRRRQAGRPGNQFPGRPGRRDAGRGARGDGVRPVRHPRLHAARPPAGVAGDRASGWSGRTGRWRRFSPRASPESLRGPQFDAAWCDELGEMDQGRGRLGHAAVRAAAGRAAAGGGDDDAAARRRCCRALLEAPGTAVTRAPTAANRMHLATGFLEAVTARYGGSRLGRQELDGELRARRRGRALELGDAGGGAGSRARWSSTGWWWRSTRR